MSERATQQEDVEDVILDVLANGTIKTTAEVTRAVKARIDLVAADRAPAAKRPNEAKIDQIIANALQGRRRLCRDGLIERVGIGQFRITAPGRDYLVRQRALSESMLADLKAMWPDEDFE